MGNHKPLEQKESIKQISLSVEDKLEIANSLRKEVWKDVIKWYILILPAVTGFLGFYFGMQVSVPDIYKKVKQHVNQTIAKQFDEPKIAQTFNEVAENQAKEIIKNNLNPAIQKATLAVNEKINSFEKSLQDFKDKYDSELKSLSEEVEYIKNRNEILKLSDAIIATGDKVSFNSLIGIYDTTTDNDIKTSALSEILRVKQSFLNTSRVGTVEVFSTNEKYGYKSTNEEVPTHSLISILLNDNNWQGRTKAAELLRYRREKDVPEVLLDAAEKDNNLNVVAMALQSFEILTNHKNTDVIDFHSAREWWEKNEQQVEQGFK